MEGYMQTRFITTREQELTEGEYVEGVVVEFAGKYFWLLENGDCTETDVSEADLNCADDFVAEECKYCGGDCPNDEEHACDGYLGDIDGLYEEVRK
jgi:hypothetical protein